jgi:hypothetical protein
VLKVSWSFFLCFFKYELFRHNDYAPLSDWI